MTASGASTPRVGWYVHHHGNGHVARFLAVRPHVDAHVTVFSSMVPPSPLPERTDWVRLPIDNAVEEHHGRVLDPYAAEPTAHGRLHWAPLGHRGHRERLSLIAANAASLDAFVVDVSAEVAAFVRLLGLPLALFSQPGPRTDAPHRLAFDVAGLIICPWPEGAHDLSAFGDARARLHTVGGISRHAGRERAEVERGSVLLLGGIGDGDSRQAVWDSLAKCFPKVSWRSAGFLPGTFTNDPWDAICRAEVVISAAGQNSVADIAAAGRPAIVVPQARPFEEQVTTARALERDGLAVSLRSWPDPAAIGEALEQARSVAPRWASWQVDDAAVSAAALIHRLAAPVGSAPVVAIAPVRDVTPVAEAAG